MLKVTIVALSLFFSSLSFANPQNLFYLVQCENVGDEVSIRCKSAHASQGQQGPQVDFRCFGEGKKQQVGCIGNYMRLGLIDPKFDQKSCDDLVEGESKLCEQDCKQAEYQYDKGASCRGICQFVKNAQSPLCKFLKK